MLSSDFSLMTWDDGVDNGLTYESFISRFLPQDNFIHEETHVHNKTVNNFFNGRPRTRHGGNFNGGGVSDCDWVEVHVNNLRQCVNDHIKSQMKKGYRLKKIESQKNGNYKVITKKGKQKFTRIFEVRYF